MAKKRITGDPVKQYDSFFDAAKAVVSKKSNSTLGNAMTPTFRGENTGFGKSSYDTNFNWNAEAGEEDIQGSINEHRANEQSGLAQAAAIIPRATTKALAEVAKIPGVVGGLIAAPFVKEGEGMDMAFNNAWIRTIDDFQGKVNEDLMPIYTAKAVREGNLWDNISSTSFWATDGADGIGFIAGMMAPGAAFEYLGLGSKLVKGVSNSEKLAKWSQMVGKAEEGTKLLKSIGASGKNIDSGLAIMGNTFLEAGAEAKGVGDHLEQKKPEFIQQYKNSPQYQEDVMNRLSELDQQRRSGAISIDEYNTLSQSAGNDVAEENFKEQRALAMRNTFVSNVTILLGPNAMMHKAIWGKAAQKFEKTAEEGLKGVAKRAGKAGERAAKTTLSEGFWEEGSQTTVENMYTNKAMNRELGKKDGKSFYEQASEGIGDFTKEYANTLASTEGQKAIFLGAALGTPMTSIAGRKQDVANKKRTNAILDNIDSQITNFNTTFDNDVYKKKEDGSFVFKKDAEGNETTERELDNKKVAEVAKNLNFTEEQSALFDLAVRTGNKQVVNKIKEQAIFNLIMPAIHNGEAGIEALQKKLSEDSKFNEIAERDLTAEEKDKSKTFINETLESAKWLQSQKERFTDFSNDVIQLKDDKADGRFKEEFLERLSASYLNSKYALRTAEKELADLERKRANAFDEAGADPLYGLDPEFPTASMKSGLVTDEKLEERASKTKEFLESNELIKSIDKEYQDKKDEIAAYKKDIASIWQGNEQVDNAYKKFVNNQLKEEKNTSENKAVEAQAFIDKINDVASIEELESIIAEDESGLSENPVIAEKIVQKYDELEAEIKRNKEIEEEIHQNVEDDAKVNSPEEVKETITPEVSTDEDGEYTSESVPESENEDVEEPVDSSDNIDKSVSEKLDRTQGGAKVISTNMKTGEPLADSLKPFVNYERTPRDKTKDKVTFGLGDIADYQDLVKAAYKRVLTGKATVEDIALLEEQLPIKVIIDSEGKKVHSFIESKTAAIAKNPDSFAAFENETLPLRKNIVSNLVANKGFDGISTNIVMQFPGLLKIDTEGQTTYQDANGNERVTNVPKNNVFDLQMFNGMSKKDKIKYFQDNSGFINWEGKLMSTIDPKKEIGPTMGESSKGEIFLRIPQNNGEPFWLKLNVNKISEEKADAVYEMVAALSNVSQSVGKKTSFGAMTVDQFFTNLDESDPETSARIKEVLKDEIALVKKFNKGDKRNESLSRFLDLIIYHKSENPKTGFNLTKDGNLRLGSLASKLMEGLDFTHGLTITKEELQSPEARAVITEYIQFKRHNILVTRDSANQFVFRNPAYVEYLLDGLLSTNAVVNQPTFQGYSNIYLNQQVVNNKPSTDIIKDNEWNDFVDNNKVDSGVLSSIAYKVRDKKDLSPREVAIFQARTSDIEDLIKQMSKEVIVKKEPSAKEVTVKTNEAGEDLNTKSKFAALLAKKKNPQAKEDVKTDTNEMKDIFNKADEDTKADMIINLADDFGMMDEYTSDEGAKKLEPQNINKTFDELLNVAKQKNKSIDDIKKICGI